MADLQKVLVVDNGERAPDFALSAELAGMGFASVTASFEAADDVLALIPSPAAIVVQVPQGARFEERRRFMDLAKRLRGLQNGVPVILLGGSNGAASTMLQSQLGARAMAKPDL